MVANIFDQVTRNHGRRMFALGVVFGALLFGAFSHSHTHNVPPKRLTVLEHACSAIYTGGGVTQCAQPTVVDSAIVACFDNASAYIGVTTEDTFHLIGRCIVNRVNG